MISPDNSSQPSNPTPVAGCGFGLTTVCFQLRASFSPLQYLFAVLVFLGLAKLLLNGAVQLTEQSHLLTVLQEACWCGRLVWKSGGDL